MAGTGKVRGLEKDTGLVPALPLTTRGACCLAPAQSEPSFPHPHTTSHMSLYGTSGWEVLAAGPSSAPHIRCLGMAATQKKGFTEMTGEQVAAGVFSRLDRDTHVLEITRFQPICAGSRLDPR